ncbi:RHS repeat-associated core domain-containing protein [Prevotella koreensis]|uniref:RHS repeat-associated core domain-containing protein n=1 Tax=Prevotella koreensis TaxID=2490854 RepID=UPI001EEF7DC2|nr:RHS repeat-associated core domain-containing protein [Prevotella koreensis]
MNRIESQKSFRQWKTEFQYMKPTIPSDETHSFILWNAQFLCLKLYGYSYLINHTYAYDDLNRLIKANGKAKSASYEMTMTFGRMSEPLTKVQKVDSTKTAQSYDFTYKYEDNNHPTAPTQIGHEHYTYDVNGNPTLVENDSLNTERRMYWDEENRLMVLSDNCKTSRYTYNAGGERIIKSHGDLEGVYVNGAPQGITFHETEDYTIYPAPIITVTKNRFTKHYFIGDKRIASKLGTGKFNNVYGISGNNVTAGQKDYAARMLEIEKQREEYYKSLGTPPGVPTMKGATADPDNTGRGYNDIIINLGDHSVPEGWVQRPKFNDKGDVPGPPVQWQKPEDPDNAQPGYGYISTDTTNVEDIFFFHSDHLGSTSYFTDAKANIIQFDAYLPYGELLVDEHTSSEDMPYKFNGKELDQETGLYYYGARYMNPVTSLWYGVDPMQELKSNIGSYAYCLSNPITFVDPNGCLESTDVTKNSNGTYTVVNAKNDGDNNIYVVNNKHERTGEIIGTTLRPYDFMGTDNKNGKFHFDAKETGITFDTSKLTVSGTVKTDNGEYSLFNADAQRLLDWGQSVFNSELSFKSPITFYGDLEVLRSLSANNAALDIKASLGLDPYTAIRAGVNRNGTPKITTLRAMGNMLFGANVHSTKPYLLGTPTWYYTKVMQKVGEYNQKQNSGQGYNKGFPYFGEHTYSGSYIYYGYYGKFYK